jgi:uncharacterized membrane protein
MKTRRVKMKKKMMIVSGFITVGIIVFMGLSTQEVHRETNTLRYADARLSMAQLQQGIEVKIAFLLDEIKESNLNPTEKGLTELVQSITMVRAYGKDISDDAKENLRKMVGQLRNSGFKNEELLKKLDALASTSQKMVA